VIAGNVGGVELLLGRKADVNTANGVGWTAAFLSVAHSQPHILQLLLTSKADILHSRDLEGNSVLHLACQYNNLDMTTTLISAQANPEATNYANLTPLDNAQEHEITKAYLREVITQNEGLIYAAREGNAARITELVELNPSLVKMDRTVDGLSALEWAIANKHYEAMQELLSSGAYCDVADMQRFLKVNVDDNDTQDLLLDALSWNQCLIQALKAGDWAESLSLVDKSACVITEEKFTGRTPLHIACSHPHEEPPFELLSALIGKKANVLARDNEGWTPLLQAVNEGHYTASACILKHFGQQFAGVGQITAGSSVANEIASILQPNFQGVSPISTAVMRDDVVFLRILADFVEQFKEGFAKMELAPWADLAGEGGKAASCFLVFHTMSFQFRLEVKMILPWVMKTATNALQRSLRKNGEHYACAKHILEAVPPVEVFEKVAWEKVFAQAPEKYKEVLEFEMEVAAKANPKAKAKSKAGDKKDDPKQVGKQPTASSNAKAGGRGGKDGNDKDDKRRGSRDDRKGANKGGKGSDSDNALMLQHFASMQKLRSHTLPTISKIDAEYYKLSKKEQTQLLMSPKISSAVAIELLLERKADPNFFDVQGQTPLFFHAARVPKLYANPFGGAGPLPVGGAGSQEPLSPTSRMNNRLRFQMQQLQNQQVDIVRSLLSAFADCNIKDNAGRRAIDHAKDPTIKQILRVAQVEKTKLFEYKNQGKRIKELRFEGLPVNREPKFLLARLQDLFVKYDIADEVANVKIPLGSIDHKPFGYAVVRLREIQSDDSGSPPVASGGDAPEPAFEMIQPPEQRFYEIQQLLNGQLLSFEKTLSYKTRDKLIEDFVGISENLTLEKLMDHGNAVTNEVSAGWKLVLLNGRNVTTTSWSEILNELGRMKEKQKVVVEVRNPKPLGRLKVYVETHFE